MPVFLPSTHSSDPPSSASNSLTTTKIDGQQSDTFFAENMLFISLSVIKSDTHTAWLSIAARHARYARDRIPEESKTHNTHVREIRSRLDFDHQRVKRGLEPILRWSLQTGRRKKSHSQKRMPTPFSSSCVLKPLFSPPLFRT